MDNSHPVSVIDFGSPYSQSLVRQVRRLGYHCKLFHPHQSEKIRNSPAIILSGKNESEEIGKQIPSFAVSWSDGKWQFLSSTIELDETKGEEALNEFLTKVSLQTPLASFSIAEYKEKLLQEICEKVGDKQVICGVSGGVDSTVLATLLHRAGVNMRAIFVDHGLMRLNEGDEVRRFFSEMGIPLESVNAEQRFLTALAGVSEPEKKRNIIGNLFLDVFWEAVGNAEILAQGTVYPDIIESGGAANDKSKQVKTHHNRVDRVLELQEQGRVLEPLSELFKDEVRALGRSLGIADELLNRHPFPGPGLAVRCLGAVDKELLDTLRHADAIFIGKLREHAWYDKVWQAYVALLPMKTVGVKNGVRSYERAVSLRAVMTEDAMTADWVELPYSLLREVSNDILAKVDGINRVFFDISPKPPASIELE